MEIPLEKRLKKRLHVDVGRLQDEAMEVLYSVDNTLVLHGGTAIWRCFSGNRFSEDLDLYCKNPDKIAKSLKQTLEGRGLSLMKFKATGNLIFAKISNGQAEIRLEMNFSAKKEGSVQRYEKINGTLMDIFCLSAEELFLEKIATYRDRRFVRDLYDLYHLSSLIEPSKKIREEMKSLLANYLPPIDEKNLAVIIYSGAIPGAEQMVSALKRRYS